jgi:hypothetical protein
MRGKRFPSLVARRLTVAILRRAVVCLLLVSTVALATPSRAAAADALPWFHTYTVPGGYAVGGVDLVPLSFGNGLRTRRIVMGNQVPANAEILAAFLYWETMWRGPDSTIQDLRRVVQFRGEEVTGIRTTTQPLTAGCRGIGNGEQISMMRADVLRLLPLQLDLNGEPTGRRLVNDSDLAAFGLAPHTVTLPDSGIFNFAPQSAGASLLVIYQDPDQAAPLTTISVYDGMHIQSPGADTDLTIRGLLDVVSGSPATLTFIGGSGFANLTERVWFGPSTNALTRVDTGNPFPAGGLLTDRAWSNPTFQIPATWTTGDGGPFGEEVVARVTHQFPLLFYDCLSTAAVIFSAHTEDGDGDGLPNLLETSQLVNPAGLPYPDIQAMGAINGQRDLFVEIGAMWSEGWSGMPSPTQDPVPGPHDHMPSAAVLKQVGDALRAAPAGHSPIAVHFDVGPTLGPLYNAAFPADNYFIEGALARGGETIQEVGCIEMPSPPMGSTPPPCRFPGFRGVVSWPAGFQFLAMAPVAADGGELADPDTANWCASNTAADCRRRFDLERHGIFHYLFYAHSRGVRKSDLPCLSAPDPMGNQTPVEYPAGTTTCGALDDNLEYFIPKSVSGVAELPGRFSMVSLGQWDEAVGTPNMQANTTLHEIGHTLDLWHGGGKPTFTMTAAGLQVFVQPQCKPNHLSIMSYMFQATGVKDASGKARARFSAEWLNPLDEGALVVSALGLSPDAPFTSWYAPKAGSLGETLGLTAATKHCDGTPLLPGDVETVRLDMSSGNAIIDWAAGGGPYMVQDVNFDGRTSGTPSVLTGHNDWDGIALDRLATGRSMFEMSLGQGLDFGGLDFGGLDFGGLDFGGLDFGGLDFGGLDFGGLDFGGLVGGLDFGGLDFGGLDFGGLDFGGLDFGGLDFGGLDFGGLDFGGLESEVDAELTREIVIESIAPGGSTGPENMRAFVRGTDGAGGGNSSVPAGETWVPPGEATTCDELDPADCHRVRLDWERPSFGTPDGYRAFRVMDDPADGVSDAPTAGQVPDEVGSTTGVNATTLVDATELPNGLRFLYWTRGTTGVNLGTPSAFAAITAVNSPPVAVDDTNDSEGQPLYALLEDSGEATFMTSVLANDTDEDSADSSAWTVELVSPTANGTLVLHADGTFSYTPLPDFFGTDTFTYRATNGPSAFCKTYDEMSEECVEYWPMSGASNEATVSITVLPVNDVPSFTAGPDQVVGFNAGPQVVANWATNISAGPANESGQAIDFLVSTNNAALFAAQPAVAPDGTLTYTPTATAFGVATVTVRIHDDGGTDNGGVDTSAPQMFTITISAPPATSITFQRTDVWMSTSSSNRKYDLKAEILKNGVKVMEKVITNQSLGFGTTFNKAIYKSIGNFVSTAVPYTAADTLSVRVSIKVSSSSPGGNNASGAIRLWYNVPTPPPAANSHLHATRAGVSTRYYLVTPFALQRDGTVSGPTKSIDAVVYKPSFTVLGTWSITGP